jgi:hypothetical protein
MLRYVSISNRCTRYVTTDSLRQQPRQALLVQRLITAAAVTPQSAA